MSEASEAVTTRKVEPRRSRRYDAVLSCIHHDRLAANGIQKGLHRIGRRVGQLHALRVFRDDTDITADPERRGNGTDVLDRARYLIVVLSPQAASSERVNTRIAYWLERRGREQLMLVLADGHVQWDESGHRFDPQLSDAAPPTLTKPGSLPAEPLYLDVTGDAPWDYRSPVFRDKITALASPIHGKPKDQLASDDLREQRRFRRLRRAAVAALAVLTVIAVVAGVIAAGQRREANRQRVAAIAQTLDAGAQARLAGALPGGDIRAFQELLAARALLPAGHDGPLLHALAMRSNTDTIVDTGAPLNAVAFTPDGHLLATGGLDATVRLWHANNGHPLRAALKGHTTAVISVAFSPDGHKLASASGDGTVRLWQTDTGQPLGPPLTGHDGPVESVAFSPDGHKLASAGEDKTVRLWNADTSQPLGPPLTGHTGAGAQRCVQPRRAQARLRRHGQDCAAMERRHRPTPRTTADRPHRRREQCGVQPGRTPAGQRQRRSHHWGVGR